ncbi:hypothetical protein AJ78_04394 [Emergomyces pasteurianus Ep9510]|uniref:Uncharacterized protein n=1 Tax=Emergomyces pasteurianus Ep9510 TaxID=1447872 RepID=A0A1J9QJG3_9EURO|nr:hypothetical protein AJ78_04394 [Emergomyces pasteurianus Ep9510]
MAVGSSLPEKSKHTLKFAAAPAVKRPRREGEGREEKREKRTKEREERREGKSSSKATQRIVHKAEQEAGNQFLEPAGEFIPSPHRSNTLLRHPRHHEQDQSEVSQQINPKDRADAQRLVTTRSLDCLHDPLDHFSYLQTIYPCAW